MHNATMAREKLFNMRMSDEEWARLELLTEHFGLNAAGVLRMLVKAKHDEVARPSKLKRRASAVRRSSGR
jgi:predicted DNA-binding protein